MTGRASVFSDSAVIDLLNTRFVPVVENVSPLQYQSDDVGVFFHHVAEQGHYAGTFLPNGSIGSRQGSYVFRADGTFLGSINSLDPEAMLGMMRDALARHDDPVIAGSPSPVQIVEVAAGSEPYPQDGLVLEATARDLPRSGDEPSTDLRWNLDYVWILADEARRMVPEPHEVGSRRAAPWSVVRRLARFHLRDYVRGEPFNWSDAAIRHADLEAEITDVDGDRISLEIRGSVVLRHEMAWLDSKTEAARRVDSGFDVTLRGDAVWDARREAFTAFAVAASGPRWGASEHNARMHDPGPAPMGIAFVLAGKAPADRTPPHCLRTWQRPEHTGRRRSRAAVPPDEYFEQHGGTDPRRDG